MRRGSPPSRAPGRGTSGRRYAGVVLTVVLTLALLAVASVAMRRSVLHPHRDRAAQLAGELSCPNCQGESVADSRSAVAASMRSVIAEQLAAGRTPEQIRSWFVRRYGTGILMDPPKRGLGLLLWLIPAAVFAAALATIIRKLRPRRPTRPGAAPDPHPPAEDRPSSAGSSSVPRRRNAAESRRPRRVWNLVAAALVAMVAVIATLGPRTTGTAGDRSAPATPSPSTEDLAATALAVGWSLERQGRFDEAVDVYRDALRQRPDDRLRVRMAYALLRVGRAAEAADAATQALAGNPDSNDALLMLGLAQRARNSPEATQTLRRFLRQAPSHPAAPEVRRLLAGG